MRPERLYLQGILEAAANVAQHLGERSRDGFVFYRSANGVWLADLVPARYLRVSD